MRERVSCMEPGEESACFKYVADLSISAWNC